MREVDFLRLFRELLDVAAGVLIALLEGLEGGGGLASEAEGLGYLGPIEFEGCATLKRNWG